MSLSALLIGVIGAVARMRWGFVLLAAAGAVEVALVSALALASARLRAQARQSIIAGRHDSQIPAIAHERLRLRQPTRQRSLAKALDGLVQTAERWSSILRPYRPVFDPRLVRATAGELRLIARHLRTGSASARATARVEQLLKAGASPLYGDDLSELQTELADIRRDLSPTQP